MPFWTKSFLAIHNPPSRCYILRRITSYVERRLLQRRFFLSILLRNFAFSAKESRALSPIVAAAIIDSSAHSISCVCINSQVTPTLRISVSFLANCAIGYMFGPVLGFVVCGLGDLIQFVIKPTGCIFSCLDNKCGISWIYIWSVLLWL